MDWKHKNKSAHYSVKIIFLFSCINLMLINIEAVTLQSLIMTILSILTLLGD